MWIITNYGKFLKTWEYQTTLLLRNQYVGQEAPVRTLHGKTNWLKIVQARFQLYMNQEFPDVQAGFRKGRRTRDQIANIRWIIEKARVTEKHQLLLY